jgi:hypothetical protein
VSTTPTYRQLAARHARRLRTMKKQLSEMSREWEDLDHYFVNVLEDTADRLDDLAVEIVGTAKEPST